MYWKNTTEHDHGSGEGRLMAKKSIVLHSWWDIRLGNQYDGRASPLSPV